MNEPVSFPYYGEDFCLFHGTEHMRRSMGNPIPWCEKCEEDRKQAGLTSGVIHEERQ